MIQLILEGNYILFAFIMFALIFSLTFHEYGHAISAYWYGDATAKDMGRLTLNPIPHIDPFGLIMIIFIGFGFAKPVPVNPENLKTNWAMGWVSFAGPLMNLILAIVVINIYVFGYKQGFDLFLTEQARYFFVYLAMINLILMIFNLIPLGPLDGHYILPYFLPKKMAPKYQFLNAKYGSYIFLVLVVLSVMGVPIFSHVLSVGQFLLPYIIFL